MKMNFGREQEALAVDVVAHRHDAPAAERVELFDVARHPAGALLRHEEDRAGDDQRVLILLADPPPVGGVREETLVGLEVLLVLDFLRQREGQRGAIQVGGRPGVARYLERWRRLVLILRDLAQLHDVGVDDSERRLRAKLAAQQPDRLLVRIDVVGAAGDESGDQHALECRDVELRLDGRLDRDLEVARRRSRQRPRARCRDGRSRQLTASLSSLLRRSLISLKSS